MGEDALDRVGILDEGAQFEGALQTGHCVVSSPKVRALSMRHGQ
jgi:hypothetical protein